MSHGKFIKSDSPYLKELIRLRNEGYSWSALGRHFKKDQSTIQYHYKKWVQTDSKTTKFFMSIAAALPAPPPLKPSFDGMKHVCCGSFLPSYHQPDCPNKAGTWQYEKPFSDRQTNAINKYDDRFDEKKKLGKSYQHYLLRWGWFYCKNVYTGVSVITMHY